MDFRDFFHSIKPVDILSRIEKREPLSEDDKVVLSKLFFWKPRRSDALQLSIGAPSSPAISNMVMYELDTALFDLCRNSSVTYTRYADDLTFSTSSPYFLSGIMQLVIQAVSASSSPRLHFNEEKTINVSRKNRISITGLVLTPNKKVSIGRDNKRRIHSLINSYRYHKLDDDTVTYLSGYLAYINSVEPSFLISLTHKYGSELIHSLFPHAAHTEQS
jgi:retron-type reverse transcriptase